MSSPYLSSKSSNTTKILKENEKNLFSLLNPFLSNLSNLRLFPGTWNPSFWYPDPSPISTKSMLQSCYNKPIKKKLLTCFTIFSIRWITFSNRFRFSSILLKWLQYSLLKVVMKWIYIEGETKMSGVNLADTSSSIAKFLQAKEKYHFPFSNLHNELKRGKKV